MTTDVDAIVIGGGVTGLGIARDLALRGVETALVERGSIAAGTSGRTHCLLHSGARYADTDPESARDCIAENRVLREIAPHCIEDTGGLFVALPDDDSEYVDRKREACEDCGILVEELDGESAREIEPALTPDVSRALRVPDGVFDPIRLCVATALDAERAGARIETGVELTDFRLDGDAVSGVELRRENGITERIDADHVVNAAGAWADRVAGLAGVEIPLRRAKGAMAIVDSNLGAVVNRCRPRSHGDIVVPWSGNAILGTTDAPIDDPDEFAREQREIDLLAEECGALVPSVADAPVLEEYWGVRPLYDPAADGESTDASRDYAVLDHANRDGLAGLTTVVGGKFTTHRAMAEATADQVCAVLGNDSPCETADRPLPGRDDPELLAGVVDRFGVESPLRSERRTGS